MLRDPDAARTYERGLSVSAAHRLRRWMFIAAEASVSAHREDFSASEGGVYDFRYQSLQGGPRVTAAKGRAQPYAEVLAGITRLGIWERRLDRMGSWTSPDFSLQPGAGLDVLVTRRVAVRFAGDVRVLFKHDNRFNTDYRTQLYRLGAGLALHIGGP